MKAITVLCCDDHSAVREGLRLLLEGAEGLTVVGQAQDGRRAVRETKRLRPDVVVMDLSMPVLNGVEATRQITREVPSAKVVVLSAYAEEQYVRGAVEAVAAGYLTKGACANDLVQAIREISDGNGYFSPPIARGLVRQWQGARLNGATATRQPIVLTNRQTEVLRLIAMGYANKQMAHLLGISIKTVEKHRQEVVNKIHTHGTAELTRYAVSNRLVAPTMRPNWHSDISVPRPGRCERVACTM